MKAYTDIEQSKVLAKILPRESADTHYVRKTHDYMGNPVDGEWSHPKYGNPNSKHANYIVQNFTSYETIPCWSLAALLDVLPKVINNETLFIETSPALWHIGYRNVYTARADTPIDACVEMIIELNKMGALWKK